jgi:type IV pilus assembly protein PilO
MSLRDPKIQKILLTVVVCGLALWGYFLADLLPFGYRRQVKKVHEMEVAQETLAAELEKARRAVADLPQLEREQADLERKWKQAELLLPTDKEMAGLLTQITQAGEQAGVTFRTFKPAPQRPQEFYNENPVDIEVEGGFHQVGVMLARLANLSRIVNVTNLDLEGTQQKSRKERTKSKDDDGDSGRTDHTLVATFTATAYSLRDPAEQMQQAPAAEKGRRGSLRSAAVTNQASTGSPSRTTPGAVTKRLSQKAKSPQNVEGAQ